VVFLGYPLGREAATGHAATKLTVHVIERSFWTYIMLTKRFWGPALQDRRKASREPVGFYAVEVEGEARYLRKIRDLSQQGLRLEDRLQNERPGDIIELELPRAEGDPVRIRAKVVYVSRRHGGEVGLQAVDGTSFDGLGGAIAL
jgi:hypothetical protein